MVVYINKEGGDEVGPIMCPLVENTDLVCQKASYSQSSTHSRLAERDSRQTIQAGLNHSNSVGSPLRGLQSNMQLVVPAKVDLFATRFNNKLPQFVSPVPDPRHGQWMHLACHGRIIWTPMPSHQQPSWAKGWGSCKIGY